IKEGDINHAFQLLFKHMEKTYEFNCILVLSFDLNCIQNRKFGSILYFIIYGTLKIAVIHGKANNIKIIVRTEDKELVIVLSFQLEFSYFFRSHLLILLLNQLINSCCHGKFRRDQKESPACIKKVWD